MIDVEAKELRAKALQKIDELSSELNKIVREMHEVSRTKIEERLPEAESKVKETELRYQIMEEYYKLLYYRDVNRLKDAKVYSMLYNHLQSETEENMQALYDSYAKLKYFYDSMEAVANKVKVGFDYYENKFKEEYQENSRLWTTGYYLSFDIKKLNTEANEARIKELGDELEGQPEA